MRQGFLTLVAVAVPVCAGVATAQNRQAISTSLTECGVIFEQAAAMGERRGKPASELDEILVTAALFMVEAREQAEREGLDNPQAHIRGEADRLADKWEGRFSKISLMAENRDWIDYCRALGKNRGVVLP